MRYSGRIGVLVFIVISFIIWHIVHGIKIDLANIVLLLFFGAASWWLGSKYDKAKFLSEKDELTGIYNRRFVEAIFPKILAQVERKKEQLSISIIDCNDFKSINDTYGHKMGDQILITLSHILSNEIRKSDIVARWGGDEFIIISPYSNQEGVKTISNRIEKALFRVSKDVQTDISVSIGTATYPHDGESLDDLIKKADQRMYKVKFRNKERT